MIGIDYMILADMATAADGKLYIHGAGWDSLLVASFPATHPILGVGLRFRIPWANTNQPWKIEIDVLDEDGATILSQVIGGEFNTGRPAHLKVGSDQILPMAAQIGGLQFPHPGTYVVVLRVDGEERQRSPFNVLAVQPTNLGR